MDYTQLGRSGVRISRVCLGTMNFGRHVEPSDSYLMMDHALEHGINFFDTADTYGRPTGEGVTETIVGDWLTAARGRREKVVLATKLSGSGQPPMPKRVLSAANIRRSCEASLRRLKTDRIDLYQIDHVDTPDGWDEMWYALSGLQAEGKIVHVGSSNFAGWHLAQAQEVALRDGAIGLVSQQSQYSLVERTVELEVLPACEGYELALLSCRPLYGGLLSGILAGEAGPRGGDRRPAEALTERHKQIASYEALSAEIGYPPAVVAIAWLLHQPAVTAPILGPRTLEHLKGGIAAETLSLDSPCLARLEEIFPPPEPYRLASHR